MAGQLFVDGSCDPHSKVGYGAMLWIDSGDERSLEEIGADVRVNRFCPCSSSSLELLAALWALEQLGGEAFGAALFTDSQTMVGLPERRAALEATGFCARSGKPLSQASLYREFYDVMDRASLCLVKLKGHRPGAEKSKEERFFTVVDRASRAALRADADLSR